MIRIVADTTCCIPVERMQELGIDFVPQIITFEGKSYCDDFELSTEEFLEKLRAAKNLPGTAAPPPVLYEPIFKRILDAGDTALVLTPPTKLSGTFRSATVAADEFKSDRIHIVDTKTIAGNLGTIVLKAKEWADQGMEIDELLERVEDLSKRDFTLFLVPTLEYLHKGGRIGGAAKLFGSLLQIVPILTLKDGGIEVYEKVRSIKQAVNVLVDLDVSVCKNNPEAFLSIGQCDSQDLFEKISTQFESELGQKEFPSFTAPPAIVVHAGPGLVVTSCFAKSK
ncbi:MAG: DegV family protein [Anaerolineaceae bacterium]